MFLRLILFSFIFYFNHRTFAAPFKSWQDRKREYGLKLAGNPVRRSDPEVELFNPNQFEVDSPEWNLAMIQFLKHLQKSGHKISEIRTSKPPTNLKAADGNQIVCKMEPFNICYEVEPDGSMRPVGDRRPIRMLRVYRRRKRRK